MKAYSESYPWKHSVKQPVQATCESNLWKLSVKATCASYVWKQFEKAIYESKLCNQPVKAICETSYKWHQTVKSYVRKLHVKLISDSYMWKQWVKAICGSNLWKLSVKALYKWKQSVGHLPHKVATSAPACGPTFQTGSWVKHTHIPLLCPVSLLIHVRFGFYSVVSKHPIWLLWELWVYICESNPWKHSLKANR